MLVVNDKEIAIVYDMILERLKTIDPLDFSRIRAYTLVLMCINTGTRNKEIRFAEVRDLDTTSWLFDIIHVKGEATYGQPRRFRYLRRSANSF